MAKASSREIIDRLKKRLSQEEKANATFRFNKQLMDRFREKCEGANLSMTAVLEELMTEFLN